MPFDPPPADVPLYVNGYSGTVNFSEVTGADSVQLAFSLGWMTSEATEGLDELFQQVVDALAALPGAAGIQAAKSVTAGYGQNCTPTPHEENLT